ncbi:unnamed protein product [Oikopleura dioica]|uniref:EGF-like domain-containing protein n=1 Tax=Oikopleura dioica TaxID=34765 RepID=E4X2C7_OIKDI|nr:unnamed protein product [Oikopleura dioica]
MKLSASLLATVARSQWTPPEPEAYSHTLSTGAEFIGGKNHRGTIEFKGVPYAQAPTGENRWKPPIPIEEYTEASYDFINYGYRCMNYGWTPDMPNADLTGEDCLNVNVHTMEEYLQPDAPKRPIMAYIHGGGWNTGSNQAAFHNLVKAGVVEINIGYRLGPWGFLYDETQDDFDHKGNFGLLDQRAALAWIQKFGGEFGGDINNVILDGCSAGSAAGWWHLTSEESWPYFHKTITNGVGLNYAFGGHDLDIATGLTAAALDAAGCENVDCLRSMPAEELNPHFRNAKRVNGAFHPTKLALQPGWGPVIDGGFKSMSLVDSVRTGEIRPNTPISFNYAEHDAWGMSDGGFNSAVKNIPAFAPHTQTIKDLQAAGIIVPSDYTDLYFKEVFGEDVFNAYIAPEFGCANNADGSARECREQFFKWVQGQTWVCNSRYAFSGAPMTNGDIGPIYPMEFGWRTCEEIEGEKTKSCHCGESGYVNSQRTSNPNMPEDEQKLIEWTSEYWVNFFNTGTFPNTVGEMLSVTDLPNINTVNYISSEANLEQRETYSAVCAVFDAMVEEFGPDDVFGGAHWSYEHGPMGPQACDDVDCGENKVCVNNDDGVTTSCVCEDGFIEAGDACVVDPCVSEPCHEKATCTPTENSDFTCECNNGYSGDGLNCITDNNVRHNLSNGATFIGELTMEDIAFFKGIPYAADFTERWTASVAREAGGYEVAEHDFTVYGPMCMSKNAKSSQDNYDDFAEQCLNVNVMTKPEWLTDGTKHPILIYIHGGGFNSGSNRSKFTNLVNDQNVMVVSVNYRLGPYGFFYDTKTPNVEGPRANFGLLDQREAMKWVQNFGAEFGGDINQITVSGCSAGSDATWWHLTEEKSWPYFNRAITNGVGLNAAYGSHDIEIASGQAQYVIDNSECAGQPDADVIDCLRAIDDI